MALLVGGPLECSWIQGKPDFEIEAGLLGPNSKFAWLAKGGQTKPKKNLDQNAMLGCIGRPIKTTKKALGQECNVWVYREANQNQQKELGPT